MQQMLLLAKRLNTNDVILDYVEHEFSLRELSDKYGKSRYTHQRPRSTSLAVRRSPGVVFILLRS